MAQVFSIEANITGLRYAEEASRKILPGSGVVWRQLEPNSYSDFGGQPRMDVRAPINDSRQRKKGVIVDLEASASYVTDVTQENLQDMMQGFLFSTFRRKGEEVVTLVDLDTVNPDEYEVAATAGFQVDDIVKGSGFSNAANNAINVVVAVVADTSVEVATGQLVAETPPADAKITVVGHQFQSGELDVDATASLPKLVRASGAKDLTTLGIIPGEFVFVGGDATTNQFVTTANNGYKRVRSVSETEIVLDKSAQAMATETGTGLSIRLFLGRVLKNEVGTSIAKRSYQLERTLGAPDDAEPTEVQAEYVIGAIPNEITFAMAQASRLQATLSFVGADVETIDGPTALKTGTRPVLQDASAFNTSSDVAEIVVSRIVAGQEAPSPLFTYAEEVNLSINNGVTERKAVGVLGAIDATAGDFAVSANFRAYFTTVDTIAYVRANVDVTMHMALWKENAGMVFDLPLGTLGNGRPDVERGLAVMQPLVFEGATGAKVDPTLDHTLMIVYFDYLPTLAA